MYEYADTWRLVVKLKSRQALTQYMTFRQISSVRQLEAACAETKSKGPKPKRAILGHLLSGKRSSCSPATARVIEEALQCPPGFLFEPTMSQVVGNKRGKKKEVAA